MHHPTKCHPTHGRYLAAFAFYTPITKLMHACVLITHVLVHKSLRIQHLVDGFKAEVAHAIPLQFPYRAQFNSHAQGQVISNT